MTAPEAQSKAAQPVKKPLTAREKAKLNQVTVNDPLLGQVIGGHYEVLECIGKGGMSVVYKTRHQLINQFRAVKILLPHRDSETDFLLRFQLEATAASRLDNKHIVRVHDFVAPEASPPYLVMDYAEGTALGDEIDKLGRLPVKRALAIFAQILDAIGHTHARGVIHRDLKPDNILLVNDELEGPDFVKLIDFGIAKLTAADKQQPQGLTPTGEVFGSPQYMSPEQCAGLTMDARSEIYSLGCILYEMLSGRAPLLGKSVLETLNMQAHTEAPPLSKLSIEPPLTLPRGLDDIVMRCLAKKPEDRFQNTEDLNKALIRVPSFDRRRQLSLEGLPLAAGTALWLAALAVGLSFSLGFGLAKMLTAGGPAAKSQAALTKSAGESANDLWQSLYLSGQKALDEGDLTGATTKLEEALSKANSLNDGQKRSASTGIDLSSINVIKQFKSSATNEAARQVSLAQTYPNNPWEIKISTLAELLRTKPKGREKERAIFRPTLALLEDSHKGNLASLKGVLELAGQTMPTYTGLSLREKLHLALLIGIVEEEQGYTQRAASQLKGQESQLAVLGQFDPLAARFYILDSRLALDEHNLPEAQIAVDRALAVCDENVVEHTVDILDVTLLRSDIALADNDPHKSLKLAKQALASIDSSASSPRLTMLKGKLLLRVAVLDPGNQLNNALAQRQNQKDLDHAEAQVAKDVVPLITALQMSDCLNQIKGSQSAISTRPKLWRAMALAFTTGRLALTSSLMQPLMVSYDTPLTQKELVKLATNRLAIDQALAAAGNHNGPDLLEDYVVLGEALEGFSLGPARDLKKARGYLNKATILIENAENRHDHLIVARVYFYQAQCAQELKAMPALVENLLVQTRKELHKIEYNGAGKEKERAAVIELLKKAKELEHQSARTAAN